MEGMIKMKLNPMAPLKTVVVLLVYLLLASLTYAATPASKWVSLDSDLKDRIKRIIQSEVESREGFSVQEDEILNTGKVEEEMIFREIPARHPGGKIAEPPPLYGDPSGHLQVARNGRAVYGYPSQKIDRKGVSQAGYARFPINSFEYTKTVLFPAVDPY
ncbi:MAG: hypothetical protein ACOYOS_02755 [Syntrophales bacterium]